MFVDSSAKKNLKSKIESSLTKMDISKICRTCSEKKRSMKNLHDIHISGYRYQEMVYVCTGFEVDKEDGLPQRVCSDCAELLPNYFTFRKRSEEVYKVLQEALASKSREPSKPITEDENPLADLKNEYSYESNEDSSHIEDNSVVNHNACIEGDNKDFESVFIEYSVDEKHFLLKSTEVESGEVSVVHTQELLMAKEHNYCGACLRHKYPKERCEKIKPKLYTITYLYKRRDESLDNSKLALLFPTVYGCNNCYKYFLSQVAVREHNKHHASLPVYPVKCPNCPKLFSNQRYVVSHTRKAHPEVERFQCGYCPKRCKAETILRTHMSGHITSSSSISDDNRKNIHSVESNMASRIKKNGTRESMVDDDAAKINNDDSHPCTDEFSNASTLEKHLNEEHEIDSLENKINSGDEIAGITYQSDGKAECRGTVQKVCARRRSQIRNPRYKSHVCNICNKSFRDFCLLKKHKESHNSNKPYICKSGTCRKYCFATKFELDLHTHVKHYEDTIRCEGKVTSFVCKFCPKVFPKRRNMREHMSSHRPDKKYQCRYCEKGFNYHHHLINHERVHTKECPYLCQECGSSFNTTDKLAVHLRRHANIKPYSCTKCDKKFLTSTQLNSHMVNHDGGSFMCSSCGKTFMALATLKKHSLYHHGSEGRPAAGAGRRGKAAAEGKPVGGGTCHICGVSQPNMKEMDAHMKTHICQYFCPKCPKGFPIISALEAHIKTHSAGERSHVCNKCGAAFNRPEHLRGHEGRVHGGYRPVACPHCPRRFMIQADLNKHVRTHTGERPYVCNECGRSFIQSTNLRMHLRQHSGERPYKCEVCQKGFCALTTLTYHMRSHYSMTSTVCKRGFAQSTSLRTHARIHTGERPYICNICHKGFHASGPLHVHMRTHLKMDKDILGTDRRNIEEENKNEEISTEINVDQPNEETDNNFSSMREFVETINENIVMIEIKEDESKFGYTELISET